MNHKEGRPWPGVAIKLSMVFSGRRRCHEMWVNGEGSLVRISQGEKLWRVEIWVT